MQKMISTMQRGGKNGGLKNEELFVQLFNQSPIQNTWTASIFSKKCILSACYLNLKRKKKPTAPLVDQSKTDALLIFKSNPEVKHKISLKKGAGRPTSSNVSETYALMFSVFNEKYSTNIDLFKLLEKIFEHLPDGIITSVYTVNQLKKEINPDPEFIRARDQYLQWKVQYNICNTLWKEMKQQHPEYVVDLFEECLSGKLKFEGNEGTADFVIDIDVIQNGIQEGNFKTIPLTRQNENLTNYIHKLFTVTNCPFATKSSRPNPNSPYKIWSRFL